MSLRNSSDNGALLPKVGEPDFFSFRNDQPAYRFGIQSDGHDRIPYRKSHHMDW